MSGADDKGPSLPQAAADDWGVTGWNAGGGRIEHNGCNTAHDPPVVATIRELVPHSPTEPTTLLLPTRPDIFRSFVGVCAKRRQQLQGQTTHAAARDSYWKA
mmetsp:Transcript_25409/g.27253  ORF Transcript_25409/g.27253 Transcript_25409/m.27253 type:complete len:102 (+) Transcript_25409:694-999(+)